MISVIFAIGENNEFGYRDGLPWDFIKSDMEHFKNHTLNKVIIMGSNTFKSLPKKLKNRIHVVMTRGENVSCKSGEKADYIISGNIINCYDMFPNHDIAIIGGPEIIKLALKTNRVNSVLISTIHQKNLKADVFFDPYTSEFNNTFKIKTKTHQDGVTFTEYERVH